jgi:hypothetical protein
LAKLPVGTRADLPLDKLPMLVRFRDISDPKSVERVGPNDLATSFGPGVKHVRAMIEITDAPVTTGIEARLGWLGKYPEPSLQPMPGAGPFNLPFATIIHHGDFHRGQL